MASGPITSWQTEGEKEGGNNDRFPLLCLYAHWGWGLQPWNQKMFAPRQESYDKHRQCFEKQKHCSADEGSYSQGSGHPSGPKRVWKELMPLNWPRGWTLGGAGEDSGESPGQRGDQTSQSQGKATLNARWKDWCWSWSSSILVTWCEQPTHWKGLWCWERLRAEGEEDIRGRDGWMASPWQWSWIWANFRRWWGTGRPGMLQSMGSQRVRHTRATEQQEFSRSQYVFLNMNLWQFMISVIIRYFYMIKVEVEG